MNFYICLELPAFVSFVTALIVVKVIFKMKLPLIEGLEVVHMLHSFIIYF